MTCVKGEQVYIRACTPGMLYHQIKSQCALPPSLSALTADQQCFDDIGCFCNGRPNGNYTYNMTTDPTKYISCIASIGLMSHCPQGTAWDKLSKECSTLDATVGLDRTCGGGKVGTGLCPNPLQCCGKYGYCGTADDFCGIGCQGGPCKSQQGKSIQNKRSEKGDGSKSK